MPHHLGQQEGLEVRQLCGMGRIFGEVFLMNLGRCRQRPRDGRGAVLREEFVRVLPQVEQLRVQPARRRFVFDQLPVPAAHTPHPRLLTAAVDAVEHVANPLLPPREHR